MESGRFDFEGDPKALFDGLVKKALAGKQSDFEILRNLRSAMMARLYAKGVKKVAAMFKAMADGVASQYAKAVKAGEDPDPTALLAMRKFTECQRYYENERAVAKDMLKEYRTYVFTGGRLIRQLLGDRRPDGECVDYRTVPWTWF